MRLPLQNGITITDIASTDKAAYLEHLSEKQIYDQTLNIPYPYNDTDAEWWVNHVAEETQKQGRSVNWAIRGEDGKLIGGIGFHGIEYGKSHRAEIGYWLAKPYWGRGIMTDAVIEATEFAFRELALVRITANVFHFNLGSACVLRKAGYQLEGYLRQHYKKDGKIFDGILFAKVNGPDSHQVLDNLEFVYLFVSDIQRSKDWYEQVLDTPPSISMENFVEFRIGANAICLHPADAKSPLTSGGSVGYWRVTDFKVTLDLFISRGAQLYRGPLDIGDGTFICQVKDPFGNVIGLTGRSQA
ncbi:MAG: GNAT family N-acetyltransferase [Bdellovibrionota bacterium]